jgi:hypothetical protein
VVPLDVPCDRKYADVRASLERAGATNGAIDTLIAAHALSLNCTIVTNNDREFARVPALKIENWPQPRVTYGVRRWERAPVESATIRYELSWCYPLVIPAYFAVKSCSHRHAG